jgi:hypothetical protein
MLGQNPRAAVRCETLAFGWIVQNSLNLRHPFGAGLGNEQMFSYNNVDAAGRRRTRYHRNTHCHRLDDFVLRAARYPKRRNGERGSSHEWTHIGHGSRNRNAG